MMIQSTRGQTWQSPPLRSARLAKGMGLRTTARKAGIEPAHLSRVERGQKQLSVKSLHRLAKVLGLKELERVLQPYVKDRREQ
jgi:transcriptional regulator with XRE-family HTH domain